jgi:hypothetical protein
LVGFEPVQAVPLAAAAGLLRQLAVVPGSGSDLDRLVFGGSERDARDPLRIFEAAHRALVPSGPMLIAIDDLQWVDDLSLGLIHYLLRAAVSSSNALIVIAAARPSPVAGTFAGGIDAVMPAERAAHLQLGPLSLAEGKSLIHALDANLDEAGAAELWRRARGSPFWLQSLVVGRESEDLSSLIEGRLRVLSADAIALSRSWPSRGGPSSKTT